MKTWKVVCTGLVALASLTPQLPAQVPAAPAAPAVPDLAGPSTGVDPGGLAKFLGITKDQKEARKRRCCRTPLMQLINNSMAPMRAFTGGALGNCCPTEPSQQDLQKAGVEGVCAKIKKDAAGVKARRAAVKCVGAADCHYWPEAEGALIAALRSDRSECVRWDAAVALGDGCCCTKRTMEALLISATGSDRDGNPAETCERVKAAAYTSLQHCLACFSEEVPGEVKKGPEVPVPEKVIPEKVSPVSASEGDKNEIFSAYYRNLDKKPMSATVEEARKASESFSVGGSVNGGMNLPSGHRGLVDIVTTAMATPSGGMKHVPSDGPVMSSNSSSPSPVVVERTPLRDRIQMMRSNVTTSEVKPAVVRPMEPPIPAPVITPAVVPAATPSVVTPAVAPVMPSVVTPAVAPVMPSVVTPAMAPVMPSVVTPVVAPVPPAAPLMPMVPVPVAPQSHSRAPIGPNAQQLMLVLRNSSYPFQREWAVNELSNVDWHVNPEVVQCLLNSAQKDSAPTVRVACVRAVVKMKVDTVPVQMTLQALKADTDPRVQREAVAALSQMRVVETVSATPANTAFGSVRPAVAVTPVSPSFTANPARNAFSR
jgi:hypothetical protein